MALASVTPLDGWRSDESLVVSARGGDRDAKAALFQRHARHAGNLAYRLIGRSSEVEDIVQESFIAAFDGLSKLVDPRAFRSWLSAIVTRTAIGTLRKRRLLARLGFVHLEPAEIEGVLSSSAPPDVLAELRAVYRAVADLPAAERVVLVLRRVEQLPLDAIAAQTGFSLATVKRRLARAEQRLNGGGE